MTGSTGGLRTKVRGILGLGIVGGFAGFVGGAIWGVASSIFRSGIFFDPEYVRFLFRMALGNAMGFMMIGAFTTTGFAALLAAADSKRSLDELPLWRMGLFGGLVAAAFPAVFMIARFGISAYVDAALSLVPVMAALGLAGGVLTSSMVAVAKRSSREELPAAQEPPGGRHGD